MRPTQVQGLREEDNLRTLDGGLRYASFGARDVFSFASAHDSHLNDGQPEIAHKTNCNKVDAQVKDAADPRCEGKDLKSFGRWGLAEDYEDFCACGWQLFSVRKVNFVAVAVAAGII